MKAIVDILAVYGMSILDKSSKYKYSRMFFKVLNSFESPKLQCIVAEGLCKLFLADILYKTDKRSLFGNVILQGDPTTTTTNKGDDDDEDDDDDANEEEETDREHENIYLKLLYLFISIPTLNQIKNYNKFYHFVYQFMLFLG